MDSQDNLDYFENEIKERCNLNGLIKQEHKNKVILSEYDHVQKPKQNTLLIADNLYINLKQTSYINDVSFNSILQFVWHKTLSIYGNSSQTLIGTSISAFCLLPLIVNHNTDNLIVDTIKNIDEKYNEMIRQSKANKRIKQASFDSLFVYETQPNNLPKLNHPLTATVYEIIENQSLIFSINYAAELFHHETIDDLLDLVNELLTQIGNNQVTLITQLNFLSMKQFNKINEWNKTDKEFPSNKKQKTLPQLFEEEVKKSSEKIALVYEDVQFTYQQLNEKANQLANYLRSICEIHPDDLIALLLDKSELMIISILGVWKSGAAYVPIDPSYPDERIEFILQDTKAKMIITNKIYTNRLNSYNLIKVDIDSISITINDSKNKENLPSISSSTDLAYVTYTSGTTGKPKGVMKEHKSVINVIIDLTEKYDLTASKQGSENIVLFSQYVFEPFIRQFLMALLNSHTLIIIKADDIYNPSKFNLFSMKNKISYLNGTTSVLEGYDYTNSNNLKRLIFAGEELTENCFNKLRNTFNGTIINEYGPTESALVSTMKKFYPGDKRINRSIGKALMNVKCYILDRGFNQLPIGAIGELYIGGIGVARGYLNRSELTAERFLPNPFQTEQEKEEKKNARIYKTGDLVRWLPDGEIEYLGRNDFQVKIRGLRIELGEIETVISSYEGVKRSVVLAKDHKNKKTDTSSTKYLVGYYVSDKDIHESDLRQFMQMKLPDYMIPNQLIRIEKIPITINGKLDTRALPNIEFSFDEKNYSAPRNELEVKLCQLWSDLLGIEKIGITDDFFRLGGDSISSLQIVGRLRQDHRLNISMKDIFTLKTIEKLYDNILKVQLIQINGDGQELNTAELNTSGEENSLLPNEEYIFRKTNLHHNHFSQYMLFSVAEFDRNKFKDCLVKLFEHHEAFRIRFKRMSDGKLAQYYATNINSNDINLIQIEYPQSIDMNFEIDIQKGPMYMVIYSYDHEDNGSARVWFFLHHLIFDLTSCRIINEELQRLYLGSNLESNSHYKHWSTIVKTDVRNIETSEEAYWQSVLNTNVKIFNETLANKQQTNGEISEKEIILTEEISKNLLNNCNNIYNTQMEHLLLTALSYTLQDEISNLKENYVMFEGCIRNFVNNLDMSQSVGMFRTIYPVRIQLAADGDDVGSSIINIKEHLKQVPKQGIGFAAISQFFNNDFPRISFNYLGRFNNENNNRCQWSLFDAYFQNTIDENTEELIKINALIINEQMKLNIKTKIGMKTTDQFAAAFQINIEKIIKHTHLAHRSYLTRSDINYIIKNDNYLNKIQLEKEVDAIFLANSLQQGFLYHSLKQSNIDDAYIVQSVVEYRTNIDQKMFKLSWEHAQKKFSSLRLRFDWQEELVQIIDKKQTLDWRFLDITTEDDVTKQEINIKQIEEQDRNERFKLDIGNLFRIYFIQQKNDLFTLIFTFHHIILDGWSLPILFDCVHQHYLYFIEGKHQQFTIDDPYKKAQIYLQNHCQDNLNYWENQINKIEQRCDFNSLLKQEYKNKLILSQYDHIKQSKVTTLLINNNIYKNLKQICRENTVTLNSILQYVWHKTLSIYGNSNQTITGTIVSGRTLPIDDIQKSVGLFINTLPLVIEHHLDISILDTIKYVQEKINDMITRSNVDFSQLNKGQMKHTLFDTLFVYENYPNLNKIKQKQTLLRFEKKYDIEKLDYPLAVIAYETIENQSLIFSINYAGELFHHETIDDLLDLVNELLTQIANNQATLTTQLNFLSMKQLHKINQWNNTDKEFIELNKQTTLHKLFEEEAEKSSMKVALIYEDVQLTYQQLNEKANQLAYYLRSICEIHSNDLIALLLDKSELMIVSILAVWKSGAAYVPIDPSYPDERIQFILEDTKSKIIIINKKYISRVDSFELIKIDIESVSTIINDNKNSKNPHPISSSNDLAYVIYTSGTTGKPKGVMIEHTGVINLKVALTELFQLKSRVESILSFSNYVFDHFVEQMTYTLLNGQVLVILNDEMRVDKPRLYQYLNKNKVTYLSGTPSVLQEYDYEQLNHIIRIDAVGEDFSEIIFNKIRNKFNGLIINGYGPTEISITSHKKLYYLDEKRINKSIGKQIANTSCYVLDKDLNQLPISAIGELYIGGIGVARGYLNRSELTAERFLPNPFQTEQEKEEKKNARIYKTGDLVRWLPDGEIEYLGRNDFQVKIRGLRIELGEIETVLSSYQGIKQSVIIARDAKIADAEGRSRKYLLGYFVSENNLIESDIKQYMQTKLPDYMIPNRLVRIEKIPVNISGKLDSRALPEVDFANYDQDELVPPRNDLEAKITQIWSELLGIPVGNIGIHDDFFSLGGDSILVIKLSLMLSNSLSLKLTIAAIFENKTIAKLALYILHGHDSAVAQYDRILKVNDNHSTDRNYALSFAQERLLFINEFNIDNGTNVYNIPIYIKFSSNNVKRDLLYRSIVAIIHKHEILRTLLRENKFGIISQHLLNETEVNSLFKINEIHVTNQEHLDTELIKLAKYVFNLRKELPIKVTFYEIKNEDGSHSMTFYMGLLMHHICFDGWSWTIFSRDLQMFYDYFQKMTNHSSLNVSDSITSNLSPLPVQYKDFAIWQRNYMSGKRLNNLLEFWKNKLDGFESLNLITDCSIRPTNYDYSGKEIIFELNKQTTTALKQLAMKLNISLFSLLLSAYTLMLSNYTNQQDILIGTPVANRNQPELENLIGFFVNMLVLRIKINTKDYVFDYIKKVSNEVIDAQIHQEMPFERLVKELQIENDPSRHPIVQVIFIMNNQFELKKSHSNNNIKDGKSIEMFEYLPNHNDLTTAKYDISTSINESDVYLRGHFNFATKLFKEETINNLVQSFIQILTRFSKLNETCQMLNIDCINCIQYNQIQKWNRPNIVDLSIFNKQITVNKLFEEEVKKSSEKIALVYEDVQFTYQQLNEKANQLANYLRSICEIHPDDLIALLLDKSELMIISILGVWKSGAAYVPIDPSYPDERIEFILQDTKAKMIITNKIYTNRLNSYNLIKVDIDSISITINDSKNKENLPSIPSSNHLAYVIYTSGTTGRPKGVLIKHEGVVSFRNDITSRYFSNNDTDIESEAILFFSNYVFDFSIEQFALSILSSQTLIIPAITFTIDDKFYSYLNRNRLTYLSGTPTQLQQINFKKLKYLKTLTIAGEALTEKLFEKIRQEYKGKIINAYGVTETTVYNMVYIYENEMKYKNSIGNLLCNTNRFVLNKNMQILPACAIGELYLTGNCMSKGYLNRPELTTERFLLNPFQTEQEKEEEKNVFIYKTGDLVRYLPDGELEYLGRNDFQVKIRGLRIELGEIEAVISSYEGVKRSVVLAKDHKNKKTDTSSTKYLVGYYVSDKDIHESDLRQFMQMKLPDYMIPNQLIRIEKIPITINGKLDTRALPNIEFSFDEKNYSAPRNELEVKLCQLWSDLLGIEKIGITDDFFRLGGDSISSLQLIGRIRKDLGLSISVKDIFVFKTIESLCHNVLINNFKGMIINSCDLDKYEENTLSGEVPLLPIQEWFFLKLFTSINHWNQAFLIETAHLDLNKLKESVLKLIDHHDAFKLRFKQTDYHKYIQYYDNSLTTSNMFSLNHFDIRTLDQNENQHQALNEILTRWQSQFDIENGPLFSVGYLTGFPNGKARVWFAMHHLIVDVVSWRILCEDLQRLYNGSTHLGRKGSSYRQWSQLVQSYGIRNSEIEGMYWRNLSHDVLRFNTDLSKHNGRQIKSMTNIILNTIQTSTLLRDCPHIYNTQINVLLLTALGYAVKELTQNRINCVTLEGHGREDIDDDNIDISRTVGWFTTMYPVILEIDNDLNQSIINVKKYLMQVPKKGIGYGTIIGYTNQDLPQISFNYLGQFEGASSTKTSNGWYLTNGVVGDEIKDNQMNVDEQGDVIAVNGFCMNGQIRFNIKTKLDSEITTKFANSFKSKLEDIICQCFITNRSNGLDYSNDFENPFVLFNENNEKILFILPPGEGGAESYFNNIVPHLSSYKLVIFNNYYLDLKAKNMEKGLSFEILAPLYIKYIKQFQVTGPYNFLGWSFGGVLSFEIARQLNNAGEEINNIFMIDSYFNVIKASSEIGKMNKIDIIDEINYIYLPNIDNEIFALNIVNRNINILLFKANQLNEGYPSEDQLELFTYYANTPFNNLDTIINEKYIRLFSMHHDSHFSWVFSKEIVNKMCNYISNILK